MTSLTSSIDNNTLSRAEPSSFGTSDGTVLALRTAVPETVVSGGIPPDRAAEGALVRDRLKDALLELPERQRIAVVLFDAEGYSHAEIAGILGVPEGTVRSYVFHARRALRVALSDFKEGE